MLLVGTTTAGPLDWGEEQAGNGRCGRLFSVGEHRYRHASQERALQQAQGACTKSDVRGSSCLANGCDLRQTDKSMSNYV